MPDLQERKIVVVGLGYVGLPLAVALGRHVPVVGLDINGDRIAALRAGHDHTREVATDDLAAADIHFTDAPEECRGASAYIVTVPTPVDSARRPDLGPLLAATRTVAGLLDAEAAPVIVYESTVYPGVTEDVCGPLLAELSGLRQSADFFLGYSPERINPGDRAHRVDNIVKVIAGDRPETTDRLAAIYARVTSADLFRAASIRVAEAAKVIENAQRDINIAFMNEITQIFSRMDISIHDVLEAAGTKWNFLAFRPGLVGGHCIGVDPYYLSHCAQSLGHLPRVILAGRHINDGMADWVADSLHSRRKGKAGSVLVLGITFKQDVPDLRNSKVLDLIRRLEWLGHDVRFHDPLADAEDARMIFGRAPDATALEARHDLVVLAVPHAEYRDYDVARLETCLTPGGTLADLHGQLRGAPGLDAVDYWTP